MRSAVRCQQRSFRLFDVFDLAGSKHHRGLEELILGGGRGGEKIFVTNDPLAQHSHRTHEQISSGDQTEYHTTLSRTRSGEERDG